MGLECISSLRSPRLEIKVNWFSNELNNPNSMFNFWFFYEALRESGNIHFPWKSTWGNQASKKVTFSCLDSYIRKFLNLENLIKRNIILVNWVSMYKSRGNQLIIFYFTAQMPVSYGPLSTLLFIWVPVGDAKKDSRCVFSWKGPFGWHKSSSVECMSSLPSVDYLERERDNRIFNSISPSTLEPKSYFSDLCMAGCLLGTVSMSLV